MDRRDALDRDGAEPPARPAHLEGDWLFATVYQELRSVAAKHMGRERREHTLQTTALVHEAYVRLIREGRVTWSSFGEFMLAAAESMRRILIERARARKSAKRGGARRRVPLDPTEVVLEKRLEDLLALSEALDRLASENNEWASIIKLRYFAGLTIEQTAEALDRSPATVKRQWQAARAWLFAEIKRDLA